MDETVTIRETLPPSMDENSMIDTSSPFRSVKEAVAVFGERFLASEIYSPSPKPTFTLPKQETPIWKYTPNSNQTLWKSPQSEVDHSPVFMHTLKKLELELEETKRELNKLKERESETEVALASLNAELHKNMSKIAKAEAEVAGKAAATKKSSITLAQVLSGVQESKYLNEMKVMKKKPIIPLVTDLFMFARKNGKAANNSVMSPLHTSSHMYLN
ncbi:hypothetical protein Tco_1471191 [Tanacetum coccineum]